MPDEPRPQRDQHRRRELEQEADPDRQPVDRDEVEPLDEREADDAVDREPAELAAGPDPEPPRGEDREPDGDAEEAPGRAQLGPPQRADPAAVQRELRDRAVEREERRGGDRQRVAEPRPPPLGGDSGRQRELGHRARLPVGRGRAE